VRLGAATRLETRWGSRQPAVPGEEARGDAEAACAMGTLSEWGFRKLVLNLDFAVGPFNRSLNTNQSFLLPLIPPPLLPCVPLPTLQRHTYATDEWQRGLARDALHVPKVIFIWELSKKKLAN
jgi:hypothetical protein